MPSPLSRRKFVGRAVATGTGLSLGLPAATAAEKTAPAKAAKPSGEKTALAWPRWDGRDEEALLDVLRSGKWGRGLGSRVKEFEAAFAEKMRARYCLATSSGTTALLTSLGALGVGPGDEVIMPPYTFVATFNAITANYALPIFVDCDLASFQIDAAKVAAAITRRTKVLLPVQIGGTPADLDALSAVARAHKITLLEDACQAPLAEWRGQPVGTIGIGGCFSFQASKNLTAGEGGAILTNDENFANLCYNYHTPGSAKPGIDPGRGANYRLTEFQAALLLAQMTRLDVQAKTRDENAAYLTTLLQKIPGIFPARLPTGTTRSGFHLYMLRYDQQHFAGLPRAKFLQALAKEGVSGSSGYTPLNNSAHVKALAHNPHYQRIFGADLMARWVERNHCPVNDRICAEAVWFSQHSLLGTRANMERTAEVISGIQRRAGDIART
jgi:dTDP-4-amino-4,6-dideoxygalactose transaminase